MRLPFLLLFPITMLLVIGYVYFRIWRLLPFGWMAKTGIELLLLVPMGLMFATFMRNDNSYALQHIVQTLSTSWIIILLYLLMTFIVVDIARLLIPAIRPYATNSMPGTIALIAFIACLFTAGYLWYGHKVRVPIDVAISKNMSKPLKIIGISDLHLGYTIGKEEAAEWVKMINAEKPDLIIIAGDVVDSNVKPVMEEKMYEELRQLQAPMGVFACLGNHDYMAGVDGARRFMELSGIKLLQDEATLVDNSLYIIGRDDRTNDNRNDLHTIIDTLDHSKPIILLDHQPYNLEQAMELGVDLQFSGHTHGGQVFPLNLVTDMMYEQNHGYLKKGDTQYYVSSGIGIWGGKFRIGTRSEYVVFEMHTNE